MLCVLCRVLRVCAACGPRVCLAAARYWRLKVHPLDPLLALRQVLAAGRVDRLADSFGIGAGLAASGGGGEPGGGGPQCMALDGSALENLEVRPVLGWAA